MEVLNRKPMEAQEGDPPALESAATPERQAEAEKLGWQPPARFKGDPERFVDAEEYIERGEIVLPIVKKQNKELRDQLAATNVVAAETARALVAANKAIEEIQERHTVDKQKAVELVRKELKAELAQASADGDHAAVAEITEKMTDLSAAAKVEEKPAAKVDDKPAPPVLTEEMKAWNAENPWFGTNKRKTALALGIADDLRSSGETSSGRAFFDKVVEEMEKELGTTKRPPVDKVESGRNGGEEDNQRTRGKSFNSLPADAKAACRAEERNFVGPNKKFKTAAEWHSRYAEIYFQE